MSRHPGMPAWQAIFEPQPAQRELPIEAPAQELLPPADREFDFAAEALMAILIDDAFQALVTACRRDRVRRAAKVLLVELCKARMRSAVGIKP